MQIDSRKEKKPLNKDFLKLSMVTRTGFEPVNAAVKGQCVKPLHQLTKWRLKQDSNL